MKRTPFRAFALSALYSSLVIISFRPEEVAIRSIEWDQRQMFKLNEGMRASACEREREGETPRRRWGSERISIEAPIPTLFASPAK